jgi:ubiquinone/menaquinone biosynthesis C-methylase UbiE
MTSLAQRTWSLAYRLQQHALVRACGVVQRLARRAVGLDDAGFSSAELDTIIARHRALLERDLENVERGAYPRALLFGLPWQRYVRRLPALARDVPAMMQRRGRDDWRDLPRDVDVRAYPPYYRRTFHWQTDGYLSRRSAELYDVSVEFLFGGTADIMRRQALPSLTSLAKELGRPLRILDLGCGTGRTLAQVHVALPDAQLVGIDLSAYYLDVAAVDLAGVPVELVEGNAEALPFDDASFDAVTSVFMFHELPRNARRRVWAEARRVLRPGGRFVVVDSVQRADSESFAYFVDRFSRDMHEPFYSEYTRDDLAQGLGTAGFEVEAVDQAYLAKVVTARSARAA